MQILESTPHRPHDPSTLLTSIPARLGFVPERSIIVIAFAADRTVNATMRHDLALEADGSPSRELVVVLAGLGEITSTYGIEEIAVVIADDRYPTDDRRYRRIMAMSDRYFGEVGGVAAGFGLATFETGAPWSTIWCPEDRAWSVEVSPEAAGRLGDPHTCPTAVAEAVRSGRRILSRRSEMRSMLEPLDGECGPARPLPGCRRCPGADLDRTDLDRLDSDGRDLDVEDIEDSARALDLVISAVIGANRSLDCEELDRLERAILRPDVRDAVLALAVTELRGAAERLWRELARRLTGRGRATAATLLAHLHYIGGDGAYAGVALDVALACKNVGKLAALLDSALRAGVRPAQLWGTIDKSYDAAARLGVVIPAVTLRTAG
ncbi:DUF4192 domain-containing protein [Gordonia sp. NPDC058843]|uniref:DUF4192 domain-containing protein n=1 Tax=Gordonia sp. NPDC058843 TaxID=3346648 RepID=UPI0036946503